MPSIFLPPALAFPLPALALGIRGCLVPLDAVLVAMTNLLKKLSGRKESNLQPPPVFKAALFHLSYDRERKL